jgi:hypothetical protein
VKKTLVAALAVMLTIVGCAPSGPSPAEVAEAQRAVAEHAARNEAYLVEIRDLDAWSIYPNTLALETDAAVLSYGAAFCSKAKKEGYTQMKDYVFYLVDQKHAGKMNDATAETWALIAIAASNNLCPELGL